MTFSRPLRMSWLIVGISAFQNDAAHRDCRRRQEKQGLVPEKRRASY